MHFDIVFKMKFTLMKKNKITLDQELALEWFRQPMQPLGAILTSEPVKLKVTIYMAHKYLRQIL